MLSIFHQELFFFFSSSPSGGLRYCVHTQRDQTVARLGSGLAEHFSANAGTASAPRGRLALGPQATRAAGIDRDAEPPNDDFGGGEGQKPSIHLQNRLH
jgi:hypothetical protein